MIDHSSLVRARLQIHLVAIGSEVQRRLERPLELVEVDRRGLETTLCRCQLPRNATLLRLEHVERHGAVVVRLHQPQAFFLEALLLARRLPRRRLGGRAKLAQLFEQDRPDPRSLLWGELLRGVMVLDLLLNLRNQQRALHAVGCLLMPPEADEVGVDSARAVLGHCDDETTAALAAEDARLQVVGMRALLLARRVSGQNVLHRHPGGFVDQRFVPARVPHAAVRDFTHVVRRGQNLVQ
ncbi:hypothetical protein FZ046_00875 [Mycolicibacterium grossiae]|nr:hypothetical protein [Mycolicibacterium grossiae]QEM43519.1 hypothetical protein FZ046_00875 [Mycolicibacterium grossiae]